MTTAVKPNPHKTAAPARSSSLAVFSTGSEGDLFTPLPQGASLTIGSGPRCDLKAAGSKPLSCVITAGKKGVTARRWAGGVLLNGVPFTEAILSEEDTLSVEETEFRVVSLEDDVPQDAPQEEQHSHEPTPQAELLTEATQEEAPSVEAIVAEADEELTAEDSAAPPSQPASPSIQRTLARQRVGGLVAALREARELLAIAEEEHDRLRTDRDHARADQEATHEEAAELARLLEAAETERDSTRTAATESLDLVEALQEQIDSLKQSHEQEIAQLQEELAAQQAIETATPETTIEQDQAAEPDTEARHEPAIESEQAPEAELEEQLDSTILTEHAETPQEPEPSSGFSFDLSIQAAEEAIPVAEPIESAAPETDIEEPAPSPEPPRLEAFEPKPADESQEPISFVEKYAHLLPSEDEVEAESESNNFEQPQVEEAPPATSFAYQEGNDEPLDESIDDYMRQMMGRLRGEAEQRVRETQDHEEAINDATETAPAVLAAPELPAEEPDAEPIIDLSELKASVMPEADTDMDALRQLANQSARQAIDVAATKTKREQTAIRAVISGAAIGGGLLAILYGGAPTELPFQAGCACVLGGALICFKALSQLKKPAQ